MVEIKVYTEIGKEDVFMSLFGMDSPFSADMATKIFADHPDEKDFKFNIHCPGGMVSEGLAIYDILRTSGKNIYTNIIGDCHSMAVTLLLAAPLENRTANANCSALIHKVRGGSYGTSGEIGSMSAEIERRENAILDIYAERTKLDRDKLVEILNEEKYHNAQTLIDWGFISKINSYTNNSNVRQKINQMSEKTILQTITNFISRGKVTNFEFLDGEGNVLFTTEKADESLAVGDPATPDGTYEIDGKTVVILDGAITEITEMETENSVLIAENETLKAENEALKANVTNLQARDAEMTDLLTQAQKALVSNFAPPRRVSNAKIPQPAPSALVSTAEFREFQKNRKK